MTLMKVSDYAKKVGLSVPAIYKQINSGKLKTVTKFGLKLIKVNCLLMLLLSCTSYPGVIVGKNITDVRGFDEVELPKGLCRFTVTADRGDVSFSFIDSCHKYNMYDTIK